VTFARLIFAAAPQSQGISTSWVSSDKGPLLPSALSSQDTIPQPLAQLPMESELRYFVDAYFEVWQPLYPFLNEESFQDLISHVCQEDLEPIQQQTQAKGRRDQASRAIDLAQLFLVLALGAKVLESRLGTEFSSDQYHATAMYHIGKVQLHDNVRGVQVLLLLVLISFCFPNGLNAWFLISTIIASCLDLGLQRKHLDSEFCIIRMFLLHSSYADIRHRSLASRCGSRQRTVVTSSRTSKRNLLVGILLGKKSFGDPWKAINSAR
jgi:hypothetical protein